MLNIVAWTMLLAGSTAGDPPTDAQVLRAMPRSLLGALRLRDNVEIVKERSAPELLSIRMFGNTMVMGIKEPWKCTVYYDYVIPLGTQLKLRNPQMEVLQFSKLKLWGE